MLEGVPCVKIVGSLPGDWIKESMGALARDTLFKRKILTTRVAAKGGGV